MKHVETSNAGEVFRKEYLNSVERLIRQKNEEAVRERERYAKQFRGHEEEYRLELVRQLGWPLNEYFAKKEGELSVPEVKKTFVTKEEDISIYRLQLEVFPEFWYYGILFAKEDGKKRPLVISQHGGQGTPELCSSLYEEGSDNYNDMTQRLLQYDVNVFAPQMLLWNIPQYRVSYDRDLLGNQLKRLGGSITAMELTCLMRSLDYLLTLEVVDATKIGMAGLSYGGMYALHMAALDVRLKSTISCSYFCDRFHENWTDWTYQNSAYHFQDAETAMLVYPRKLHLAMGDKDHLFSWEKSCQEFERIKQIYADDLSWIDLTIFHGDHEFIKDDTLLEKLAEEMEE